MMLQVKSLRESSNTKRRPSMVMAVKKVKVSRCIKLVNVFISWTFRFSAYIIHNLMQCSILFREQTL